MAKMDALFTEMIAVLEEASGAVQRDLEQLATARPCDFPALMTLKEAVSAFAFQADSVFAMMIERNAPDPLVDRAEELVEVFHAVQVRLVAVLQPEQR